MTVLTTLGGHIATKRHAPSGTKDYNSGAWFTWREAPAPNVEALGALLASLEGDPRSFVVLGAVAPEWQGAREIPRRPKKPTGERGPSLVEAPSRALHIDLDALPLPEGMGWDDPEGVAQWAWASLGARVPALAGVACYWQASSSAGLPGKAHLAKLHFWAMLDSPLITPQRKALLGMLGADDAPAGIGQPNYTAAPLWEGVPDPLAGLPRSGMLSGAAHIRVSRIRWPELPQRPEAPQREPRERAPLAAPPAPELLARETTPWGRSVLDGALWKVRGATERNKAINHAAFTVAGAVAAGQIEPGEARAALEAAAIASGHARWEDTLARAWDDGLRRPMPPRETWAPVAPPRRMPPAYVPPKGTLADARAVVARLCETWRAAVLAPSWGADALGLDTGPGPAPAPPVGAARVTVGVGKSYAARRAAIEAVMAARERGDGRAIVLAVPRHDLGAETQEDVERAARELGAHVTVRRYFGRAQLDPRREPVEGVQVCQRPEERAAVESAGERVFETLCARAAVPARPSTKARPGAPARPRETCPLAGSCYHMAQRQARADVWIVPHALLWGERPAALGDVAGLVVDEDPTGGLYGGFDAPRALTLDDVRRGVPGLSAGAGADVVPILRRIADAASASGDGRLDPRELGLDAEAVGEAREALRGALAPLDCGPASTPREVKRAAKAVAARNGRVRALRALLGDVREALASGAAVVPGLTVDDVETPEGTVRKVRMRWRERLGRGWEAPTLCLSATARGETLRAVWPQLGEVVEASAAMPHVRVRQILDRTMSASALAPPKSASPEALRAARRLCADLRAYIEARHHEVCAPGERTLVIAQKAVLAALRELGPLPEGVETAHFGGLSGLDRWGGVRLCIVVGRPMPSPRDVELRAEVLTGQAVEAVTPWYPKAPASLPTREGGEGPQVFTRPHGKGGAILLGTDRHPDAMAEAIRWGICEGELVQGAGRPRGVSRTAETPLALDMLTNVPLPVPVDEAATWRALLPSPEAVMAARGVHVPDTGARGGWGIVAAVLPDFYASPEGARDAVKPAKDGAPLTRGKPYRGSLYGNPRVRAAEAGGWGTMRAVPPGGRYAAPVEVRAATEGEALAVLARWGVTGQAGTWRPIEAEAPPEAARAAPEAPEMSPEPLAGGMPESPEAPAPEDAPPRRGAALPPRGAESGPREPPAPEAGRGVPEPCPAPEAHRESREGAGRLVPPPEVGPPGAGAGTRPRPELPGWLAEAPGSP